MTYLSETNKPEVGDTIRIRLFDSEYNGSILDINFEMYGFKWILLDLGNGTNMHIKMDTIQYFCIIRKSKKEQPIQTLPPTAEHIELAHVERVKGLVDLHKEKKDIENSLIKDTLSNKDLRESKNHYVMPSFKKRP